MSDTDPRREDLAGDEPARSTPAAAETAGEAAPDTYAVPGVGVVEERFALTDVALPLVSFEYVYRFPDGAEVRSTSTLRFRSLDEVRSGLDTAGLELVDVRDAPDRPDQEYVVLARRRA